MKNKAQWSFHASHIFHEESDITRHKLPLAKVDLAATNAIPQFTCGYVELRLGSVYLFAHSDSM